MSKDSKIQSYELSRVTISPLHIPTGIFICDLYRYAKPVHFSSYCSRVGYFRFTYWIFSQFTSVKKLYSLDGSYELANSYNSNKAWHATGISLLNIHFIDQLKSQAKCRVIVIDFDKEETNIEVPELPIKTKVAFSGGQHPISAESSA